MMRWVAALVRVMPHSTWGVPIRSVSIENGSGGSSPGCISTAAQSMVRPSSRGGVPVFSRPRAKSEPLQGQRQTDRRRLAYPPRRGLALADMDQAAQEGSGGEHDGPCPQLAPVGKLEPGGASLANDEIVGLGFDRL